MPCPKMSSDIRVSPPGIGHFNWTHTVPIGKRSAAREYRRKSSGRYLFKMIKVPAQTTPSTRAHPPETLEGWFALHQIFAIDRDAPSGPSDHRPPAETR